MSIRLLYAIAGIERAQSWGNAMIEHTPSDDLESLFYIFIDFVTTFDGLKGSPKKAEWWNEVIESMGTAAAPYKSGLVLVLRCDRELMDRITTYFGRVKELIQAWHYKFLDAHADQTGAGITHEEIEGILNRWISHEAVNEPLPPED
jgi:hypothetical protein